MRADHPAIEKKLTRKKFLEASHVLVTYRGGGHRVIEEALERAGVARRIDTRAKLIPGGPARVARVYERQGRYKALPPPLPMPPAEVAVHWHERFEADPGNRWLRQQIIDLFAT